MINKKTITTQKKIPKLRFPGFSDEWEEKKLGDIFQRITTKNEEDNHNVLTISAQHGLINQEHFFTKKVSSENLSGYYLLQKDDFAYNKSYSKGYPMGAIKRLTRYGTGVVSPLYICFRKKDGAYSDAYLEKYLEGHINHEIGRIAQEGARNHGLLNISTKEFFSDIKFFCPATSEQQKIADFLGTIDESIDNLRRQKEELEAYKKGIMQKIFSQEIRFKDDNGNDFPEWGEKRLGDLFVERLERKGDKKLDLLSVTLGNGVTKQSSSNKPDNSSEDKSNYKVVDKNDIVYNTMRMWQGASGVSNCAGCASPAYTVIGLKEGSIDFYKYLFKQPRVIFDFYRYSQGLTSDTWNLKFKHFSRIAVNVPGSTEEQEKIARILSLIDDLINFKKQQIVQAEEWKRGLMQKLFI